LLLILDLEKVVLLDGNAAKSMAGDPAATA